MNTDRLFFGLFLQALNVNLLYLVSVADMQAVKLTRHECIASNSCDTELGSNISMILILQPNRSYDTPHDTHTSTVISYK